MAYVSPTINPSGTTFAQFRAGGLLAQLARVAAANSLPAPVKSLMLGPFDAIRTGVVHSVDAFNQGDPVATVDINAKLLVYATALKAITAAVEEICVLVSANPGTLVDGSTTSGTSQRRRRVFP